MSLTNQINLNLSQLTELTGNLSQLDISTIKTNYEPHRMGDGTHREYVVVVRDAADIDSIERELESWTGDDHSIPSHIIPDRVVGVANRRPGSPNQTHYFLTYDEAESLRADPRVVDVELLPESNPLIGHTLAASSLHDFTKQDIFGNSSGAYVNYGLYRCSKPTNVYGNFKSLTGNVTFDYHLDGSGVDVVIMDNGVLPNHPEWQDANGVSRFQQVDWYVLANISGTMPSNYYTTSLSNGHGTHVAGIVAGKTFGWAKNAKIYSMNILGSDANTTISTIEAFDLITKWHQNKPIDPATGFKRPTIVNGSWSVSAFYSGAVPPFNPFNGEGPVYVDYQVLYTFYRGGGAVGTYGYNANIGLTGTPVLSFPTTNSTGVVGHVWRIAGQSTSYNDALTTMLNAGVHYITVAGNDGVKSDLSSGPDGSNTMMIYSTGGVLTAKLYNSPASPWSANCVVVGAVDTVTYNANLEKRGSYSHFGTAVDIWAPGTGIISAWTSTGGAQYTGDNAFYQQNESGTSMAAPQVAGVAALLLQMNPGLSPYELKKQIKNMAANAVIYDDGVTNNYSNGTSLGGGANKFLYNPWSQPTNGELSGGIVAQSAVVGLK